VALVDVELSWKFLDKFPKDGNLACLGGALKISVSKFSHLGKVAHRLSRILRNSIADCFDLSSGDRVSISAGNVTSVFSLPKALRDFMRRSPNIPVFAKLVEPAMSVWKDVFEQSNVDIMLVGLNIQYAINPGYLRELVDFSTMKVSRRFFDDPGLITFGRLHSENLNKKEIMEKENLLFGRMQPGVDSRDYKGFYFSAPKNRINEEPRVISDHYFMSVLFMESGAGIWHTFGLSFNKRKHLTLDDEPVALIRRYLISRPNLPKKLNCLYRRTI